LRDEIALFLKCILILLSEFKMKQNVALALGSGGARGLAHIGIIEELERSGFNITSVSGCSIGSLIGGFYAMGKLQEFSDWICSLKKMDVYNLMDVTISQSGLLKGEKVFNKMKELIPDILIEDMNIPYSAVATDILNRSEVVFDKGSFYKAARASIAIPAVFTPVEAKHGIIVDGGLLNPVPVNIVRRTGDDLLVAVNLYDCCSDSLNAVQQIDENRKRNDEDTDLKPVGFSSTIEYLHKKIKEIIPKSDKQSQGYISLLQLTTSVMISRISYLTLEVNKPDILISIPADTAKTFEFHKATKLIETGRKAAIESIERFNRDQAYIS
jgi:NTE family protein